MKQKITIQVYYLSSLYSKLFAYYLPENLLVYLGFVLIPKKSISVSRLSHIDSIRFFIVSSTLLLFYQAFLLLLAAGGVVIVPVLGHSLLRDTDMDFQVVCRCVRVCLSLPARGGP